MMTALWIVLGLALFCLLGGCAAVLACSRGQHATEAEIDAYLKPYPIHDEAMAAQRFVLEQEPEQLYVESYDGKRLHAQLLRTEDAVGTILLFHGYRSSWNVDFSASLLFYRSLGYNLLLVDQRAHQDSEGTFLTFGAKERYDVISWVTYLGQMLGQTHPLFLGGLSMGATTVLLASCFEFPANVRGLIADCGFTEAYAEMRHVLRGVGRWIPARFVLFWVNLAAHLLAGYGLREADTRLSVAESRYPILFIHGTGDDFVPCEMTKENFAACTAEKECVLVEGAQHGCSYVRDRARVEAALRTFLERHTKGEDGHDKPA